jgi:ribosome maturation protein SDO1
MVKLEDAVVARLTVQGMNFEALVDPWLASEFKSGKEVDIRGLLATDKIFKDSRKGDTASTENLLKIFGTDDPIKIAREIIRKGEVQVTTEQRRRMREEKMKQIVSLISRRAINPQTRLPHPPARIEGALEKAKVHIDEFKSVEEQLSAIIKAIRPIIPLKLESRKISLRIPASHVGRCNRVVREYGKVEREEWMNDGSWSVVVEIPAGIQGEFFDKLNQLTKGEIDAKVI